MKIAVALAAVGGLVVLLASFAGAQTGASTTGAATVNMKPVLEIGPNGNTLLRGTLVSVGSNVLTVQSWGGNWTINVVTNTEVLPKITGTSADISNFAAGDFIGVQGTANQSSAWTIDAKIVRDWTVRQTANQNRQAVHQVEKTGKESGVGKIFQGAASNVASSSFTLTSGNVSYAVNVGATTSVINRNWLKLPLVSIQNGDNVRVFGTASGTVITAEVVRDVSVPR